MPCYDIEDQTVYKRLEQEGWQPLAQLFERISILLVAFLEPALQAYHQRHRILAPFATEVIALDEMHLDQVSRRLPILKHFKKGDAQLLPGKLVALFDVRLQQWRAIDYIAQASENGLEVARALLLRSMKQGALLLADLGYFGFEWFQAKAKPTAGPVTVPTGPQTKTTEVPTTRVAVRPRAPVQPDHSIVRPPWPFLRPLVAEA